MSDYVPTVLAVVAVVFILVGLWAMTAGSFALAGTGFLSASIVIYLRETRVLDGDSGTGDD